MKKLLVVLLVCFQAYGVKHREKLKLTRRSQPDMRRSKRLLGKKIALAKKIIMKNKEESTCIVPVNDALLLRFVSQYGDN